MSEVKMENMNLSIKEGEPHSKITEGSRLKVTKELWIGEQNKDQFKILDPNDPLMKRFQDALQAHLTRINNKLSDEIFDLETAIKVTTKKCEEEDKILYNAQSEIAHQQQMLENYQSMLSKLKLLYEENNQQVKNLKELHKKLSQELQGEKSKEKKLIQNLKSLGDLEGAFTEWEKEIDKELSVSKRMSEKDAAMRKELIQQKQHRDYILFKLMNEVHKIEEEIWYLDEQLQLKDKEKIAAAQTIADANADLEALQRDQKNLLSSWNSVLFCINQRDNISDQLNSERRKIRESFQNLQTQVDKLKKDSNKEMENNEQLMSIQLRTEDDMRSVMKLISTARIKIENLESQFVKMTRLVEQSQKEYQIFSSEYQQLECIEKNIDKEFDKLTSQKIILEEEILSNLDDKVTHDKAVRHLNKLLCEAKDVNQEQELLMIQTENVYAKNLYEKEKLNSCLEDEKSDLQKIIEKNIESEKEIDQLQTDISRCETLSQQNQRKIMLMKKKIDEMSINSEESNPLDLKIVSLEKNIEETEIKNQKLKQFWLRKEGNVVSLSQQRNAQTQEISLISKQITIMEQKNSKLEFDIDKQNKEKANIERTISIFQQRLTQINSRLAAQKGLKDELENKTYSTKNEYVKSLENAETDLIKLQNEIKYLLNEKLVFEDQLLTAQRESLSWEKKVQLAIEYNKSFKEAHSSGGDVAIMKSEIHKMEMRLSHLRKIQEKLIQDMEFCIARRDVIIDCALAKEKKNPKAAHNQRIVLRKRLDDQRSKIKQIAKETKHIENNIAELEAEQRKLLEKLNDGQKILRENEDIIPDIEKQIVEADLIKYHNLEILVRKQRKASLLQDVKNGRYKMFFKSEASLNEAMQNQQVLNAELKEIMNQTNHDFPLLKNNIRKILLTLGES